MLTVGRDEAIACALLGSSGAFSSAFFEGLAAAFRGGSCEKDQKGDYTSYGRRRTLRLAEATGTFGPFFSNGFTTACSTSDRASAIPRSLLASLIMFITAAAVRLWRGGEGESASKDNDKHMG